MPADVAAVFAETMSVADDFDTSLLDYVPESASSVTAYNFRNPQLAWRSVVLTSQKKTDPLVGRVLGELSGLLFEPYGIKDSEKFLTSVGQGIVTAKFDDDEKSVAVTNYANEDAVYLSLDAGRFTPSIGISPNGDRSYGTTASDDDPFMVKFFANKKLVLASHHARNRDSSGSEPKHMLVGRMTTSFRTTRPTVVSVGRENSMTLQLISLLAREGHGDTQVVSTYLTETRFTKTGMERRTVSDFGFTGWMIAQLAAE